MNSKLILTCTALLGVALGSLAFSKAGIAIAGGLAILLSLQLLRKQPKLFSLSFQTPFLAFLFSIALATLLTPASAEPWAKIDGLWPLSFLFCAGAIGKITPKPMLFFATFLGLAGAGGLYSVGMAIDWLPPHKIYSGRHIGPTHIFAFSVVMTTALPVALDFAFRAQKKMRFLWVLVALLSLFALVSTGERANTGVGCLIAAFVPALHFKSGRAKLIGVGILLLAIPAILHFGGDKLAGLLSFDFANLNSSDTMRAAHWSVAWDSWKTAPLFGHGLGTYSDLAVQHPVHGDFLRTPVRHGQFAAHSYPLHTLATQGLFGLACVCWCAAAILMSFVRAFKARPQAATYGIFACLIFAGTSLTDTPMYQSVRLAAFTLLAGFSYGLIVADQNKMLGSKQMTPPKEGVL